MRISKTVTYTSGHYLFFPYIFLSLLLFLQYHYRAMMNFVAGQGLAGGVQAYFKTAYGVYRAGSGGSYTSCSMHSGGCGGWQVPDGGRWWIRDSLFNEPSGDYTAYCWLGMSPVPNPYLLTDLAVNDGSCGYSLGNYYLVSTNAKP